MNKKLSLIRVIMLLFMVNPVLARTLYVDGANGNDNNSGLLESDAKQSIGAGLSSAVSGDEVLVSSGIYTTRDLSFDGKDLHLRSQDGASTTIIDCSGEGRAFVFSNGETTNALLSGFTLRNGKSELGGSIWIVNASPRIEGCVFEDNQAVVEDVVGQNGSSAGTEGESVSGHTARGGVVFVQGGHPYFSLCRFESNSANGGRAFGGNGGLLELPSGTYTGGLGGDAVGGDAFGGVFYVAAGGCVLERCEFRLNLAKGGETEAGDGGGRSDTPCYGRDGGNASGGDAAGSAIYVYEDGAVDMLNCVFWKNTTQGGSGAGGNGGRSDQGYVYGGGSYTGSDTGGDGGNGTGGSANGGAIAGTPTNILIKSCTFAENIADGAIGTGGIEGYPHTDDNANGAGYGGSGYGGAVYGGTVVNSILWDNTADSGSAMYNGLATYSVVDDGTAGAGTVSNDPYFVQQETGDLRIGYGSSAIDIADGGSSPILDMSGTARPQLSGFDMGAYEVLYDAQAPEVASFTPADGTFIEQRDITITVRFSERVQGVDVSDLVLSGSSATGAVVTAVQLIDGRYTYQFIVNDLAAGSLEIQLAPDAGDIKDIIGNNIAPTNWSYSADPILVYHVRADISASGDGRTWATAKKTLAEAVTIAEGRTEIWIQHGTNNVGTVTIPRGLKILGGFGGNEEHPDERPASSPPTIFKTGTLFLSGGKTTIEDIHFVDNTKQWLVASGVDLCLRRCVFSNNRISGTSRTATGTIPDPNGYAEKGVPATGDSVDGIVKVTQGEIQLMECSFIDNQAGGGSATGSRGGLKSYNSGRTYYGAKGGAGTGGSVFGCGISIYEGAGVVYNCSFINNRSFGGSAYGGDGGGTSSGTYCYGGNGASAVAGSVYGSAIYGDVASSLHIYNSLFVNNNVTGGYGRGGRGGRSEQSGGNGPSRCSNGGSGRGGSAIGGAVYGLGEVLFVNCTSVENVCAAGTGTGGLAGYGSYMDDGYPGSSINGTGSHGGCYAGEEGGLAANSIFSLDVPSDAPTTNWHHCSFSENPGFIQPEVQDYRLNINSPWLDAGTNSVLPIDVLDLDGDGDIEEILPVDLVFQPRVRGDVVDLGAYEGGVDTLGLALPSGATENDGVLVSAGIISIQSVRSSDLTINLISDDTSVVTIPATVIILEGNTNATFDVTIIDDGELDGVQSATINASADMLIPAEGAILVNDDETTSLTITLPASATEGATVAGAVTVSVAPVEDALISLNCNDASEVTVPIEITLLAGQTSAVFNVSIVNDTEIDGTQIATVSAQVSSNWNWSSGMATIDVLDDEDTNLVVSISSSVTEGDGVSSGTVSISGTLGSNLVVSLASDDSSELTVPTTVIILAGQTSASFSLTVVDDADTDGTQTATVSANASGFVGQDTMINVEDNDVHHFVFGTIASQQIARVGFGVTITAKDINDVAIPSYNGTVDLSGTGHAGEVSLTPASSGSFASGVWNGVMTVDDMDSSIVLTADDGAGRNGTSTVFDVSYGPLDHFTWEPIASPQNVDIPFDVTITARDANANVVSSFGDTVGLVSDAAYSNSVVHNACYSPHTKIFYFANVPPAGTSGVLNVYAKADLGSSSEYLTLSVDGEFFANLFVNDGGEGVLCSSTVLLTHAKMEELTSDGRISFAVTPSASVNDIFSPQELRLTLTYLSATKPFSFRTDSFVAGVWNGAITVVEAAINMFLFADDGNGHIGDSNSFDVEELPPLTISVPASATEGCGVVTGEVTVSVAPISNLVVNLVSDDVSEVTVSGNVTILAGQTNVTFDVQVENDTDLDGTQNATITASAFMYQDGNDIINVYDNETATLGVGLPANATEGVGVVTGQVTISAMVATNVMLVLESDTPSEATVPDSVIVLAGQTSAFFDITILEDTDIDGTQPVTITAHVENWTDGSNTIEVLDNEHKNLVVTMPASITECDGPRGGTVSISGTLGFDLVVSFASDDSSELTVPTTVIILAGQTSAAFNLTVVDDADTDGTQTVTVSANASGFVGQDTMINVEDNDVHHFVFGTIASQQIASIGFAVTITAKDVNDIAIPSYNETVDLSGAGHTGAIILTPTTSGAFVNGVWSGVVTINFVDSAVVLTADDGLGHSGVSTVFDVTCGSLDHFTWDVIAPTQHVDTPFLIAVAARDAHRNLVTTFAGSIDLTGLQSSDGASSGNSLLQSTNYNNSWSGGNRVRGVRFTPTNDITVTHVRRVFGDRVSIWTDAGSLLTEKLVSGASGIWVETPLDSPLDLIAGRSYRIGAYLSSSAIYYADTAGTPTMFPDGTIDAGCWSDYGYSAPLADNPGYKYLVDLIYTVGTITNVLITPTNTDNFVAGVWTGNVTVLQTTTNLVVLKADDGSGHIGDSNPFNVFVLSGDADGDGLPDAWENRFGGDLDPTALCANGINTIREAYIAGLDPTNASSRLMLNPASGNALHWSAISGRVYSIWWTTNLLKNFQPLETNLLWPQGGYTNPSPSPTDYYKIKVELE